MDETSTTAMLVGSRDMLAAQSNALTATLSRDEIEGALASEPPDDLILEVLRSVEGQESLERRTVNVAWDRTDLESVLSDADAEAITFSFDPAELERILSQPDVEGHGLREAAVVLSIAAAAAVGGPSVASAEPGGAWAPQAQAAAVASTHDEATLTARGIENAATPAAHDEATLAARGIETATVAAAHDEATLATRGIETGTVASVAHDEATLAARGIEPGTLAATSGHDEATLAVRGIEPGTLAATSGHDEATLATRGIAPGTLAVSSGHDEATLAARGIEPAPTGTEVAADSGTRFDLSWVDSNMAVGLAAALAAFGVAIAGASFASRRREPGPA